jgi:hypothetical protein
MHIDLQSINFHFIPDMAVSAWISVIVDVHWFQKIMMCLLAVEYIIFKFLNNYHGLYGIHSPRHVLLTPQPLHMNNQSGFWVFGTFRVHSFASFLPPEKWWLILVCNNLCTGGFLKCYVTRKLKYFITLLKEFLKCWTDLFLEA